MPLYGSPCAAPSADPAVRTIRAEAVYGALLYEAAMAGRLDSFFLEMTMLLDRCAARFPASELL